jgi:aryl-alcohol dehydrogenase-like predicted oxidoreductase
MHSVMIPGTSLVSSKLGFGTASLHHLSTSTQQLRLLAAAADHGMTHFDTAPMYGEGLAERILGTFLRGRKREMFTLATKVGFPSRGLAEMFPAWMYFEKVTKTISRKAGLLRGTQRRRSLLEQDVEASFSKSLRRLQADFVDILLIHEPSPAEIPEIARLADWLRRKKESGRARYLGLAANAGACVAIHGHIPGLFDILQVEDSIDACEADAVSAAGLPLQLTYGYLRASSQRGVGGLPSPTGTAVLTAALSRNRSGVVLVSTRKLSRIAEFSGCVSQWVAP